MSSASIVISQSGVASSAGLSRDDLVLAAPVTLSNSSNVGVRSWRWTMVDRPTGSAAVLSSPTAAQVTFTPDVAGSYLVQLVVDDGRAGQIDRRIAAVRETINAIDVRWPAAGEDDEANWGGNTRGYLPDLELLFEALSGGGAHAASHLPGGADPLTTAAPVSVGTANAAGSAASFSRSDHVHALSAVVIRDASVVFDYDLAADATQDFSDGSGGAGQTLMGIAGTVAQRAAAGTWGLVSTAGLRWIPAASTAGGFNSTAQTAPFWHCTLGQMLGSALDAAYRYVFEIRLTTQLYDTGATTLYFGLWGVAGTPTDSVVRVRCGGVRQEGAPNIEAIILQNASTAALGGADLATMGAGGTAMDTFGFTTDSAGISRMTAGQWSGGWPTEMREVQHAQTAPAAANSPIIHPDTRFVFSFNQISDGTPTAQFDVANFRVRRIS